MSNHSTETKSDLLTCVISLGQSNHPDKRALEDTLAEQLSRVAQVEVIVVPNLYDLNSDSESIRRLRAVEGDMILFSWLYERGARWILDRNEVRGQVGESLIKAEEEDEDDDDLEDDLEDEQQPETPRVNDSREIPNRRIYCLDLRLRESVEPFVAEVERLIAAAREGSELMQWISGTPDPKQLERYLQPTPETLAPETLAPETLAPETLAPETLAPETLAQASGGPVGNGSAGESTHSGNGQKIQRIDEKSSRRWYPVIDFSRCTNCMECIDFCLFGVYGVDESETILVEQPDNCRKGCPACSRVCPENAIIFPQHKTPGIAGAASAAANLKIDLSQLFGAPNAVDVAAQERDEQLLMAGREAVGLSVGIPKRQDDLEERPKDDLDDLVDELDQLDL